MLIVGCVFRRDTSDAPPQITNPIGIVVLAQGNTLLDISMSSSVSHY